MNELTAKVSEATALQNPTPTELALLKRLEDCAVVMRGMADMMRTTNERMGALEREVRMLTKVTPAQATAINHAFAPAPDKLGLARQIVAADDAAAGGPCIVAGKLVDLPVVKLAHRVLDRHARGAAAGANGEGASDE